MQKGAMQKGISHQHPLHLRPVAPTVIITFQTMTHPHLMAIAS